MAPLSLEVMRPKFCTGIGCVKICQENNNGSDCSKNDFISNMCLSIGQFLNVFQFFIRGSSRLVQEVITACLFPILGQNVTKEGFDPKNNTFVPLLCFVVGATLNKRASSTLIYEISPNFKVMAFSVLEF